MSLLQKKEIDSRGLTMIEVVVTLLIIGILAAVVVSRANFSDYDVNTQAFTLSSHIRYAQTSALGGLNVWGIKCDSSRYWMFSGTAPDNNIQMLPDDSSVIDSNRKLVLASKKISIPAFTIYFDGRGIPYSSYTDATTNTPLGSDLARTITETGQGSGTRTVRIAPLTGFVTVQ